MTSSTDILNTTKCFDIEYDFQLAITTKCDYYLAYDFKASFGTAGSDPPMVFDDFPIMPRNDRPILSDSDNFAALGLAP